MKMKVLINMSKKKKCSNKIFLKFDNRIFNFMWVQMMKDASIMMGFSGGQLQELILKIFEDGRELDPHKDYKVYDSKMDSGGKITFHSSGWYKLTKNTKIGLDNEMDRVTVKGKKLSEIDEPTRMLEILIPSCLLLTTEKPVEGRD